MAHIVAAVNAEIATLRGEITRPGIAAGCEVMASVLARPQLAEVWPEAMAALQDGLDRLREAAQEALPVSHRVDISPN